VAAASGAWDLGGRTGLRALAGGLAACDLVVANDTGPMHMAAALGRPLVVTWGAGDPVQTRPLSEGARVLSRPELPCHPCLERECPRSGPGTFSPEARRECLTLLETREVEVEVRDALQEGERVEPPIVPGDAPGVRTGGPDRRPTGEAADE